MSMRAVPLVALLASTALLAACERGDVEQPPHRNVSYAEDVAPILDKHCAECHLPGLEGAEKTGFTVDSYASLMQGSQYGPVIEPGNARTSSLYILITAGDHLTVSMPHGREPLSADDIETLRVWIDNGAVED